VGSESQPDCDYRRHADGNQKVYDLGKDIHHRPTMRPGSPFASPSKIRNGPVAWCSAPGPLSALDGPKLRGRYSIPNAPGIITLLRLWNESLRGRRIAYRTGIRKRERFDFCGCQYGIREQSVGMRDTFEVRAAVVPTTAH